MTANLPYVHWIGCQLREDGGLPFAAVFTINKIIIIAIAIMIIMMIIANFSWWATGNAFYLSKERCQNARDLGIKISYKLK